MPALYAEKSADASGKIKIAFRMSSADNSAMDADEVRTKLKAAIADRKTTATALSLKLRRSPGYLSDFFRGKKLTLAAAESEALEKELRLPQGSLVVKVLAIPNAASSPGPEFRSPDAPGLSEGEEAIALEYIRAAIDKVFSKVLRKVPTPDERENLSQDALELLRARRVVALNDSQAEYPTPHGVQYLEDKTTPDRE